MTCPYCNGPAILTNGAGIYRNRPDLALKFFWACMPCQSWVGCHPGTTSPLGRIANAELRAAKSAAHVAFDPIWRSGTMSRSLAYAWLAARLGIAVEQAHIGHFGVATCRRVIEACGEQLRRIA